MLHFSTDTNVSKHANMCTLHIHANGSCASYMTLPPVKSSGLPVYCSELVHAVIFSCGRADIVVCLSNQQKAIPILIHHK